MNDAAWPNGKKIAVAVAVMFETWSEGAAPNYSVQTTHLRPGTFDHASKAWSTYGGKVGVWRIIRLLDQFKIKGTFLTNAQCAKEYPDAVKQIVKSGHDLAAHAITQDQLMAYLSLEEQEAAIRKSIDMLEVASGKKVTGWASPVLAFTPETNGLLAKAGLRWTLDVTYSDVPIRIDTPHGPIAGVPAPDFTDNRVLRGSPEDFLAVYINTFNYLLKNEPGALLVLGLHCHFGGRPLIAAAVEKILTHVTKSPDVWFARHEELGEWALNNDMTKHAFRSRFF